MGKQPRVMVSCVDYSHHPPGRRICALCGTACVESRCAALDVSGSAGERAVRQLRSGEPDVGRALRLIASSIGRQAE